MLSYIFFYAYLLALFVFIQDNFLYVDMLDPRAYTFSNGTHVFWLCVLIVMATMPEEGERTSHMKICICTIGFDKRVGPNIPPQNLSDRSSWHK